MATDVEFSIINIGTLSMNKYWNEKARVRQATATCTLLRLHDQIMLVDPSPYPPVLEKLLFANAGLKPSAIDSVFITHFHEDHLFGLQLFPDAKWMMAQAGIDEWIKASQGKREESRQFISAEANLPDCIDLLHTPGHTYGSHSLGAETRWGYLIVAGDSVMNFACFSHEEGHSNSVDFDLASQTIRTLKNRADLVIPGHGNFFLNT